MKRILPCLWGERLEDRCVLAGNIVQVGHFDTWDGGVIPSTDVSGITFHAPSGHLYLADSEISELPDIFTGANVFETSPTGDQLYREIVTNNNEPTGITYNEFDGYFYVTNDTGSRLITRYDATFSAPLREVSTRTALDTANDPEGITSDPATGNMYVIDGSGGGRQVLVYNANLQFQYHFSVAAQMVDAEGIAFHPPTQHLFVVDGSQDMIFEYALNGTFVESYDLNDFQPEARSPQGLAFGPTSDPTDNPSNLSLYIADGMRDNFPDGQVFEAVIGGGGGSGDAVVVQSQVAVGSDDAEERPTGGVALASSDLELTVDSSQQTIGLRFTGVGVPRGATIQNASIQFQTDEVSSDPTSLTIRGQAADNAATFSATTGNITSRSRTSAAVTWNPAPWTVRGEAGPNQRTPNLAAVVQEIVNRPGWSSGNSLAIIINGTGKRVAEAFEGLASAAARLRVEYLPSGTPTPTNQPPTTTGIANVAVAEDAPATAVNLFAAFEDAEDSDASLIYTIQNNTNPALFSSTSIDATLGRLTLAYAPNTTGSAAITVRATDRGNPPLFVETSFNVNVAPVNDPPVRLAGSLNNLTVAQNSPATSLALADLAYGPGGGADESSQTLTYRVTAVPSSTLGSILLADGTTVVAPGPYTLTQIRGMQFRPAPGAVGGPETFSFRVTDNGTTGGTADPKSLDQSLLIQVSESAVDPIVLQLQVTAGSDDAEEMPWGGMRLASTDLDLMLDGTYQQTVGLRFTSVSIPRGATIQHASIQFQADETSSDPTSLTFRGQAADQAPTFSDTALNITNRSRTSAAALWNPPPWLTRGEAGPDQQTPNLAAVIQEIVNRPGWASGNPLAIIIDGTGKRVAKAFEGGAAAAPKLRIEYLPPASAPVAAVAAAMIFADSVQSDDVLAREALTFSPTSSSLTATDERRLMKREIIAHEGDGHLWNSLDWLDPAPSFATWPSAEPAETAIERWRHELSAERLSGSLEVLGSEDN